MVFRELHLRVLDGVGGSHVVFTAAVPPGATVLLNVRVVGRNRHEEVNLEGGGRVSFVFRFSASKYRLMPLVILIGCIARWKTKDKWDVTTRM